MYRDWQQKIVLILPLLLYNNLDENGNEDEDEKEDENDSIYQSSTHSSFSPTTLNCRVSIVCG